MQEHFFVCKINDFLHLDLFYWLIMWIWLMCNNKKVNFENKKKTLILFHLFIYLFWFGDRIIFQQIKIFHLSCGVSSHKVDSSHAIYAISKKLFFLQSLFSTVIWQQIWIEKYVKYVDLSMLYHLNKDYVCDYSIVQLLSCPKLRWLRRPIVNITIHHHHILLPFLLKAHPKVEMGPDPTRPKLTFDPQ